MKTGECSYDCAVASDDDAVLIVDGTAEDWKVRLLKPWGELQLRSLDDCESRNSRGLVHVTASDAWDGRRLGPDWLPSGAESSPRRRRSSSAWYGARRCDALPRDR